MSESSPAPREPSTRLGPRVRAAFVSVPPPDALIREAEQRRLTGVRAAALRAMRSVANHYDASAWLDAYRLVLLDTGGFDRLLPAAPRGTLLDIGAGTGEVHAELARLFRASVATETSEGTAKRARDKGIDCRSIDLGRVPWPDAARFDVVALLNVVDRADRPLTLLDRAKTLLAPGGHLLLATPLPLRAHVHRRGGTADPDEWLGVEGDDFEASLTSLLERVLAPRGWALVRWTRTPYVSSGDAKRARYDLDDAVLVLSRT
ncbi:MAG: methyltransferase domain-containing protein [Sandaracinaceae bacterium]|nr:methyltransferase domain-containing protein [Sandaracinaceae bacterium]